jgi:hypothetical protein
MFDLFNIEKITKNYFVTFFSNTGSALFTSEELAVLQAARAKVDARSIADNTTFFIYFSIYGMFYRLDG